MSRWSAPSEQLLAVREGGSARCRRAAAVGERIGRDVDDAHHLGRTGRSQRSGGFPDGAGGRLHKHDGSVPGPRQQNQNRGWGPGHQADQAAVGVRSVTADGVPPPPIATGGACAASSPSGDAADGPAMMSSIWSASMVSHSSRPWPSLHLVAVVLDQAPRQGVLLVDDAAHLGVDLLHGLLAHVGGLGDRAAQEDLALVLGVDHGAEPPLMP